MSKYIGILPCAGSQKRFSRLAFSKELLPLADGSPVISHTIKAMRKVTYKIAALVHPHKLDLIDYLKSKGVIVIEKESTGLPISILQVAKKFPHDALFGLPDTYYKPTSVYKQLTLHQGPNVLGLFESGSPEKYDSVKTKKDLAVDYAVKVSPPLSKWTMGCGKISKSMAERLWREKSKSPNEHIFGDMIYKHVRYGRFHAIKFRNSQYQDLGTPESYQEFIKSI